MPKRSQRDIKESLRFGDRDSSGQRPAEVGCLLKKQLWGGGPSEPLGLGASTGQTGLAGFYPPWTSDVPHQTGAVGSKSNLTQSALSSFLPLQESGGLVRA